MHYLEDDGLSSRDKARLHLCGMIGFFCLMFLLLVGFGSFGYIESTRRYELRVMELQGRKCPCQSTKSSSLP